jgi:hypothetical protein
MEIQVGLHPVGVEVETPMVTLLKAVVVVDMVEMLDLVLVLLNIRVVVVVVVGRIIIVVILADGVAPV